MINSQSGMGLVTFRAILFLTLILTLHPQSMMGDTGIQKASRQPPAKGAIESSIRKGIDFLISDQNKDGSWGSARNTKGLNIYAPVPGAHHAFRAAITAMCVNALIETNAADQDPKAKAALERGEKWILKNLGSVRRANHDAIYNVWGHSYGIAALVAMHNKKETSNERKELIKDSIRHQIKMLQKYESVDGGWGYYDFRYQAKQPSSSSISFTNSTALVALKRAEEIGIDVPDRLVKRAFDATKRQQKPDFSYAYGEYLKLRPMRGINLPGGSLGRSQACNIALKIWGDEKVTDKVLDTWLDRLWARNGWLSIGRKRPIPHESWFQVAGYFYYYGHYYASLCIEDLSDKKNAEYHKGQLAAIMLPLQEKEGSWWDYPFYSYHRPYGTAFALMTLVRCL
ncbi:MAG: prenyltransferase/squalene oxidase repeat-containing protein [Verrucomicrobiota bacterium]|nr:prenyltransferase/squalene oxidase repeat-containing protein [Verrucomicrobiota bacterium]